RAAAEQGQARKDEDAAIHRPSWTQRRRFGKTAGRLRIDHFAASGALAVGSGRPGPPGERLPIVQMQHPGLVACEATRRPGVLAAAATKRLIQLAFLASSTGAADNPGAS
ncbi:MAG TPA: hypothetical protein VIO94_03915, partial [Phenylobacterium sp.]